MFVMKKEFYTGIEMVDQEHERLFEIANKVYETLLDEFISDKYDYIVHILKELTDYAMFHFDHEEEYMASIHYKKLFSHKVEHENFKVKLEEYNLQSIDDNQIEVIKDLLTFLGEWLVDHILQQDKLIAQQ